MEIREYAEALLFGREIEEKLRRPRELSDVDPGPVLDRLPLLPARPEGLRFLDEGESRPREARFPARRTLGRDRDRGRVMHFFANHELLALELMALTLLRFPDAPAVFRRALVGVMIDEQNHLELYLQRMEALGCELGALPCGRFFWDRLKSVPSPRHFLAGMSLGFEQANLDFSLHYMDLMSEHDDAETLEVLQRVHEDEIRHVRRGLELFREDLEDDELFSSYSRHLEFPLGPQHGRGRPFSREARRQAGLPEDFIDEMEAAAASKGRPPFIRLMNPSVEDEIAGRPRGEIARLIERDLALLPALVAGPGDVVLAPKRPSIRLRLDLQRAGFGPVEWLDLEEAPRVLVARPLGPLAPFGRSPRSAAFAAGFGVAETGLVGDELFDKTFALDLRDRFARLMRGDPAERHLLFPEARTLSTVEAALDLAGGGGKIVKAAMSSAGRGQLRLSRPIRDASERARLTARMSGLGALVVEDLLDRVADLSLHLDRTPSGEMRSRGLVRFYTDRQGQFLATETATALTTLDQEMQRFLAGEGESLGWFARVQEGIAALLQESLAEHEGSGPIGVDMMIVRDPEGRLRLQPLVEMNPRLTMGRLALAASRRIRRGVPGLFTILQRRETDDPIALARDLTERFPIRLEGAPPLLTAGLILLGDVEPDRRFLPVLAIGPARQALLTTALARLFDQT